MILCKLILSAEFLSLVYFNLILQQNCVTDAANWEVISTQPNWEARNGHATAVFQDKIWLTGGRSNSYIQYDQVNKQAVRREDVWYYEVGESWTQQLLLTGDFSVQNFDALDPGQYAPWYSRFGHTLTAYDMDGDGENDCMILIGGFSPDPNNDVWITLDGETWNFIEYAPFSGRGWHGTVVHKKRLFVIGGSPLNNEVWVTDSVTQVGSKFHTNWYEITASENIPWMPRAGFGLVVQNRTAHAVNATDLGETMYILGGYGGWPSTSKAFDGVRGRNDVWKSIDGANWELVTASAGWASRAWFGAVVWHADNHPDRDVVDSSKMPRIWITGGGYMGTMGNNIVRTMEAYVDTWWSRDGANWVEVSSVEGEGSNLKSTQEWAEMVGTNEESIFIGKWGHTMVAYKREMTVTNDDGSTSTKTIPAMIMIGGDYVDDGTLDKNVFYTESGVLCDIEGVECNDRGYCADGIAGCVCTNDSWIGEYCSRLNPDYQSIGCITRASSFAILSGIFVLVHLTWV